MAEKENKTNNTASDSNVKPEKKMTRYDKKMQRRQEEELRAQKQKKMTKAIGLLIVIICVGAIGWNIYNNYQEKHGPYVTVGEHTIQKAEYDYYFYSSLNNFTSRYGQYLAYFGLDTSKPLDQQMYSETLSWKDYFDQQAVAQIKQVYALNDEASANGFEYDASEDYNKFVSSIEEYASEQEKSADEYCKALFGQEATVKNVETYVKASSTASAYYDSIQDATEITEDEINAYYEENKDNYDSVDYRICKIPANMPEEETEAETEAVSESETEAAETESMSAEESEAAESEKKAAEEAAEAEKKAAEEAAMAEAKAKADEMLGKIKDEDSFKKVYGDYAEDAAKDSLNTNVKKASVSPSAVGDWLFDASRKAGDKTVIEYTAGDAYYVVYFIDRRLEHAKTVDVRHILISAETDDSDDAELTDEEKAAAEEAAMAAAKTKAEDVYKEWLSGEATEDSFAALAETYSTDPGSNANGGLYEAVAEGDMIESFNDWIFDAARKPGDTGIVETSYGYHVMYFVGDNAEEWHVSIKNRLLSDKMSEYISNLTADLEVTDKRGNLAYLKETAAETETSTESETNAEGETKAEEITDETESK